MVVHIALFKWKKDVSDEAIEDALWVVKQLKTKIPGLHNILTGKNFSKWAEGYSHAVVVLADDLNSLESYRNHPEHKEVAEKIESMEEKSLGVDFEDKIHG